MVVAYETDEGEILCKGCGNPDEDTAISREEALERWGDGTGLFCDVCEEVIVDPEEIELFDEEEEDELFDDEEDFDNFEPTLEEEEEDDDEALD